MNTDDSHCGCFDDAIDGSLAIINTEIERVAKRIKVAMKNKTGDLNIHAGMLALLFRIKDKIEKLT